MTDFGLVRVGASAKLSLWSKFGDFLRRSSVQTLPNIDTVRDKATITSDLSLFSKFGGITAPERGQGATVGGDLERCQETEGNLHIEASLDSLMPGSRRRQHDDKLGAWMGQPPTH